MKKIMTYKNELRNVALVLMLVYLLVLGLSIKYSINICVGMLTVCMAIISIVVQSIFCFINIHEKSDYEGNNNELKLLLSFVILFIFTAYRF